MCGISGLIWRNGRPASEDDLRRMNRLLAHRGPDGAGTYIDGSAGLGHTRLAILDLTESGHQPMSYGQDRYWISYNGEVYNFIELRDELRQLGHDFRSDTDTEVILAAYAQWGPDCVTRFNGMWAFAIWDAAERSLFLSRDRFGIKPLYYVAAPDGPFAFASEIKALLGIEAVDLSIDPAGLATAFALPATMDGMEGTAFRGVRRLLPGYNLRLSLADGTPVITRWWRSLDHLPDISPHPARQAERVAELLFDSCRLRLRSDVSVGTCLSGGLDSSSVFGVVNRIGGEQATDTRRAADMQAAYIARFPGADNLEQQNAEAFARDRGAALSLLDIRPEDAIGDIARIVYDFEETGLLYPAQWMLYRELRNTGTRVSLDGHGADECLAGYSTNATHRAVDLTNEMIAAASTIDDAKARSGAWAEMVRKGTLPDISRQQYQPIFDPRTLRYAASDARYLRTAPLPDTAPIWQADAPDLTEMDLSFQLLYSQGHGGFLQWILRTYDMASMAHGVEVRTPFLDWRLFCYCLALPSSRKISGGFTKYVLRQAMAGIVPQDILANKRKTGFPSPVKDWLDGPLRPAVDGVCRDLAFTNASLWDGQAIAGLVAGASPENAGGAYRAAWPYVQTHLLDREFKRTRREIFA